jgi:ABC-type antimicrobial peptide transport system permease subunit
MSRMLLLGWRLALGGGREGLVRLIFMAVGVGVGVALLLLALTAPGALKGRSDRTAWQDAAYSALSPETNDDPNRESADGALFLAVSDYYDGQPMTRAYLAALGDDPPVPPGLSRAPRPGEVAVSPALRRLLESTPDGQLADRFPGQVTLTIGPEGLAHDNDLVGIIGRTPEQLRAVRSVGEVHGFTDVLPTGWAITAILVSMVLMGSVLVLVPTVILIVLVTRVAWRQRERRLAAIRLVGATHTQISLVAAAEAAVAAVGGALLGWGLYELGRRILAETLLFQRGHFWIDDLAVPTLWLVAILVGTPILVALTTVVSMHGVHSRPLAVQRRSPRGRPSIWWAVPLVVGLGGQFALVPFRGQLAMPVEDGEVPLLAALGAFLTLVTVVGFALVGPWIVGWVGRAIARVSRTVPSLLAARRIADNPQASFASVAAVGLAALALAYVGCTVAVGAQPNTSGDLAGPWHAAMRPGVVSVMTGGVPSATVEPLLAQGAVPVDAGPRVGPVVPCAELARVLYVSCPYPQGSELSEPSPGSASGVVALVYVPTDGTLAAENRVRTVAANLMPNAIINSSRDPVDRNLETFFQDIDRFAAVAGLFVLIVGAFGLAVSMVGGLIERRRPFALLRASGMYLGELRRTVLLETAATMTVVSVVGAGIGMLLALAAAQQGGVQWRWPGWDVYGLIGGGVLAALLFSLIALPLLNITTRQDDVRFE